MSSQSENLRPPRAAVSPIQIVVVALFVGLAARAGCTALAPRGGYIPDHRSNMGWATYAVQHGPWNLYDLPAGQPLHVVDRDRRTGELQRQIKANAHAFNYPPLSAYVFWTKGLVWHALDDDVLTAPIDPAKARERGFEPVAQSRLINTHASRVAEALPNVAFDLLMAWGVAMLVRAVRPQRSATAEALAFGLTLIAPPIFLDSSFWGQADSWIAALLVWCFYFVVRERFIAAGVLYGLALVTKPQAILLGPVFVYVFAALRFGQAGSWRRALAMLKMPAVAIAVALFVAAPFMISDARSGASAWRWFERSYAGQLGSELYTRTTMKAFNIWWLDFLAASEGPNPDLWQAIDSRTRVAGITKDAIGRGLLIGGIFLAWVLCAARERLWRPRADGSGASDDNRRNAEPANAPKRRRKRPGERTRDPSERGSTTATHWDRTPWLICAFLVTFAAFLLPTRVHERYIYYCIPFGIALCFVARAWLIPVIALLLVATFEMTSYAWVNLGARDHRVWSGALAVISTAAFVFSLILAALPQRAPPSR